MRDDVGENQTTMAKGRGEGTGGNELRTDEFGRMVYK